MVAVLDECVCLEVENARTHDEILQCWALACFRYHLKSSIGMERRHPLRSIVGKRLMGVVRKVGMNDPTNLILVRKINV